MNQETKRITLALLPQHLDYIVQVLTQSPLRYVDVAPIVQDIQQQVQSAQVESAGGTTSE